MATLEEEPETLVREPCERSLDQSQKNRIRQLGSPERYESRKLTAQRVTRHVGEHPRSETAREAHQPLSLVDDPERVRESSRVPDLCLGREAARLQERLADVERGRDGCGDGTRDPASSDVGNRRVSVGRVDLVPEQRVVSRRVRRLREEGLGSAYLMYS